MAESTGANADRWSATLHLINRFYLPLREQDQIPEERIVAAEQKLGVKLPKALREWLLLAGMRADYMGNQDQLCGPEDIAWSPDAPDVLFFSIENQHCCEWGIQREDLGREDPPVVEVNPERAEYEEKECVYPHTDSISAFFAWMVHEGLFLSGPINNGLAIYGGAVTTNVPEAMLQAFRENYPQLPGPQGLPGNEVRGDDDTLLRLRRAKDAWWLDEEEKTGEVPGGDAADQRIVDVALRTVSAAERFCAVTGFPADELQHSSRYWAHRFGPGCRDVTPGYILRQPFPPDVDVDDDALMQTPYCQADAGGPTRRTYKLEPAEDAE